MLRPLLQLSVLPEARFLADPHGIGYGTGSSHLDRARLRPRGTQLRREAQPEACGIQYSIADSFDQLMGAFRVVYQMYRESQLTTPNHLGVRLSFFNCLATTDVMTATLRREVVATVTLIGDSAQGLPMEATYPEIVADRRAKGLKLAEVGALAHRDAGNFKVVRRMMQLLSQRAERRGVDELVIVVNPRHVDFYQRFFFFKPVATGRNCQAVCNQPGVAMIASYQTLERSLENEKRVFGDPIPERILDTSSLSAVQRLRVFRLLTQLEAEARRSYDFAA